MKMPFLALALILTLSPVFAPAQGTINFANFGGGVDAPVTNWDGTGVAGWKFLADLWWAPGLVTDSKLLVPLGAPSVFHTNGYFLGGTRAIPGIGGGNVVTVQVRVFDSYTECVWDCDNQPFQHGESALFQVTLTAVPDPPASLIGLAPFGLSPPTTRLAPQFTLNTLANDRLLLTWPPSAAGTNFGLQQNPDLTTTNWFTLPQIPLLIGPEFQIAIPKPAGTMFYRLVAN